MASSGARTLHGHMWRSSGVLSNTIPKEGGNALKGYFFGSFANDTLQNNNLSDDLKKVGLTRVNSVNVDC